MSPNSLDLALRDHLVRLLVGAIASLSVGVLLACKLPSARDFGLMTAGWSAVNAIIALASLRSPVVKDPAAFRSFLAFNQGLNVAYIAVGVTMALLAAEKANIRQFGLAVIMQGAILFLLDGWLWRVTS